MARIVFAVGAVLLAGCSASAEPTSSSSAAADTTGDGVIALAGTYRSHGTAEAVGRVTVDVVDTRQSDAKTHLAQLEARGASCFFVGADTYRCTTPSDDVPASSLDAIAKANSFSVTFGKSSAPPALVSQAESLTEWQINQRGSSANGAFDSYRYLELEGGLVKIILPDGSNAGQGTELIVKSSTEIGKYGSVTVTESHWRFFEDSALVVLR